jgi:hypothetical protein
MAMWSPFDRYGDDSRKSYISASRIDNSACSGALRLIEDAVGNMLRQIVAIPEIEIAQIGIVFDEVLRCCRRLGDETQAVEPIGLGGPRMRRGDEDHCLNPLKKLASLRPLFLLVVRLAQHLLDDKTAEAMADEGYWGFGQLRRAKQSFENGDRTIL